MTTQAKEAALDVYLRDHMAGAVAGSKLATRIARQSEDPARQQLQRQICQDRDELRALAGAFGVREGKARSVVAGLAAALSRLKFEPWFDRSHSGELLELETLSLGIEGKRRLWSTLLLLDDPRVDRTRLESLEAGACHQIELVERLRRLAAEHVLPTGDRSP